jgi:putative ABC transport system substrate-binding protein
MRLARLAAVLVVCAAPLVAVAQAPGKVYRIGLLGTMPHALGGAAFLDAFKQGLREHGYVEGRNLVIERRFSEGKTERLPGLAAELVRLKVDLIVAPGTPHAKAAIEATKTLPIVIVLAADPVATGFVRSLARPGGNVTGLSSQATDLTAKQLQLLKELAPGTTRVAVLWDPSNPVLTPSFKQLQAGARALQVELQSLEVRSPEGVDAALAALTRASATALVVLDDQITFAARRRIAEIAVQRRIPAIYGSSLFVEEGGLLSYSADLVDLFRRSATYIDRILKGAKPADLPVEQPTKFELAINLKTAKALGLTIPPGILLRADRVVE